MTFSDSPNRLESKKIFKLLAERKKKLVLVESCTGGMASAFLTQVPGVSKWFCGSLVTYQNLSKSLWLKIPLKAIEGHGPVSLETAEAMAVGALLGNPHADVSAAITGHLGPNAPTHQDGLVFIASAIRGKKRIQTSVYEFRIPQRKSGLGSRSNRMLTASHFLLKVVRSLLQELEFTEAKNHARKSKRKSARKSN